MCSSSSFMAYIWWSLTAFWSRPPWITAPVVDFWLLVVSYESSTALIVSTLINEIATSSVISASAGCEDPGSVSLCCSLFDSSVISSCNDSVVSSMPNLFVLKFTFHFWTAVCNVIAALMSFVFFSSASICNTFNFFRAYKHLTARCTVRAPRISAIFIFGNIRPTEASLRSVAALLSRRFCNFSLTLLLPAALLFTFWVFFHSLAVIQGGCSSFGSRNVVFI